VPAPLDGSGRCRLAARSDLVATLADQVRAGVADADTPEWATQRGSAVPTHVLREVQVGRAAMQVSPDDRRPTGPVQLHKAARTWQRHLDRQVAGDLPPALQEWGRLLDQVIPGVTKDAFTSALVDRLAAISRAGVDASQLLCSAASTGGPLPDDHVAAALWWRISRHLTPTVAANVDTDHTHATTWTPRLDELLGADRADALQSSRWWPPLITAVDQALQRGWRLDDLLGAADRPQDGFDDLGQALLWRIVLLTDPTPTDEPYEPFLDSAPPDKWPDTELGAGAISTAPDEIVRPEQRWAVLAGQLDERLLRQEDWPALAQLMQQVHEQGHDVAAVARSIVTTAPLNDLPAQDLRYRFVAQLHLGVDPHPNPVDTATAKTTTRPESRWKAFASSLAMTRTPPR
jgi:hypothetical protein